VSNVLGIIGTAGRGLDWKKLTPTMYEQMLNITEKFIVSNNPATVVSGGAAWADHLAVTLYLKDVVADLTLYLPHSFDMKVHEYLDDSVIDDRYHVGRVSNWYHKRFSDKIKHDSLDEIFKAIEKGAKVEVGNGFFDRNALIAKVSTHLIAFTFGNKETLKDGGTANTMAAYLRKIQKFGLEDNSYHIDLSTMTGYKGAKIA
jgi:hypothetical protein